MARWAGEMEFDFVDDGAGGTSGAFVATAKAINIVRTHLARGEVENAVRLYEQLGAEAAAELLREAETASMTSRKAMAEMFVLARDFGAAGRVYELARAWADAGRLYEQAGDFVSAARCFHKEGDLMRAEVPVPVVAPDAPPGQLDAQHALARLLNHSAAGVIQVRLQQLLLKVRS